MSLATFLDLVWMEIWDDCAPMGDQFQYRRIMKELFLDGVPPHDIWYDTHDDKGKKIRKRLSEAPSAEGGAIPKDALQQAREMRERAIEAARKAREQAENKETE
jgi:hypothetical protein